MRSGEPKVKGVLDFAQLLALSHSAAALERKPLKEPANKKVQGGSFMQKYMGR